MPNNDFLLWAGSGSANVESQAAFASDPARTTGEVTGKASSARANKLWRQASMWAVALAQFVNSQGQDANDDGNPNNLQAAFAAAISASFAGVPGLLPTTGDAKLTLKTAADPGWIIINDGTIGNASSNATTRANADTSALFTLCWNNTTLQVKDSTGNNVARGASASADFSANRQIQLPLALGRSLVGAGAGAGLTARALGSSFGAETQAIAQANIPVYDLNYTDGGHAHAANDSGHTHPQQGDTALDVGSGSSGAWTGGGQLALGGTTGTGFANITVSAANSNITIHSNGGGVPLPIVQPSTALNIMIKL